MAATATRDDGNFAFYRRIYTDDVIRVIVDLDQIWMSELNTLQLLKYNIFWFIN